MKTKGIITLISLTYGLYACTDYKKHTDYTFLPIKTFETNINFEYLAVVPGQVKINQIDSTIQLFFQNMKSREIFSYKLNKKEFEPISEINFNNPEFFFRYYIVSTDSIYMFYQDSWLLTLKNSKGSVIKTYPINHKFITVAIPPMNLMANNNQFLLGHSSRTLGVGEKKDRLTYYKTIKPILLLRIKDTILTCQTISKFPDEYISTGNDYYDYYPSACFGKDGNICVSFGADDYLYLYQDSTLLLKKKVKSKFIDQFNPYPDEKRFDMLYLRNYWAKEPKYSRVIFDPYENLYYRIVKHRANKTTENSKENLWSVMILDDELNVLGEVKINTEYRPEIFIPTPFGIVMAKESAKHPGNAVLSLQKIKRDAK
jgi:hypothetical protein